MQTKMPTSFKKLASILREVPIVNVLLKPLYHSLGRYLKKNRFNALHENGISVLEEFDKALTDAGIFYTVYAGTLLGAIREKGILKHDLDIDTAVFAETGYQKIRQVLHSAGFKLIRFFEVNDSQCGREETYCKDGVDIDIFYVYFDEKGNTFNCDFHAVPGSRDLMESMQNYGCVGVRRCDLPVSRNVIRAPFEDITVNVIENAHEWLKARYGAGYMIPDPNYKDTGKELNIYEWATVKAVYKLC